MTAFTRDALAELSSEEGVADEPRSAPLSPQWDTLRDAVASLQEHGNRVALEQEGCQLSYDALFGQVKARSHWLLAKGVRPGDRVVVIARNDMATPAIFWACMTVGAIFVPLNPFLTAAEIAYTLDDAGPAVVFADSESVGKLPQGWAAEVIPLGEVEGDVGIPGCSPQPRDGAEDALPAVSLGPEDGATIVYTSGTTGRPKGVFHTHRNYIAVLRNARLTGAAIERTTGAVAGAQPDAVVLHALPWFHVAGLGAIFNGILGGATNIVMRRWDAAEAVRIIQERSVTSMGAVPTMWAQVVAASRAGGDELSTLSAIHTGASAVPTALLAGLAARAGEETALASGYGLTETTASVACILGPDLFSKPGSIGVPYPGNDVRLVDESRNEVPVGHVGEIWVKGPTVASGYWRDAESTDRVFVDGGFLTGDLGRLDEDGYLFIVGRSKDVIIRGGENIQAAEVESAIAQLDQVMVVAVVGMPHEVLGEEVVAVVNAYPDADLSLEQLEAACRARLAPYKMPARYVLDLEIPKNATGKAVKSVLREQLTARVAAS